MPHPLLKINLEKSPEGDYGTGDTRTLVGPITVGNVILVDNLEDGEKRTYSFGVSGFLDY